MKGDFYIALPEGPVSCSYQQKYDKLGGNYSGHLYATRRKQ